MATKEEILEKAKFLNEEGKSQEVIELLSDNLLQEYNDAELYLEKAISCYYLNEFKLQSYYTEKALEIDPQSSIAYISRGVIWGEQQQYDKAIEDYTKAINLEPNYDAYVNRGTTWQNIQQYDKAIEDYTKAIDLEPGYVTAYFNMGNVWYNKEHYDKAIKNYTQAIELKPDYASAYYNRGNAWYYKEQYDKAIEDYNKAIELKPDNTDHYIVRGNAWSDKQQYDKAIEDYSKAIDLKPDYAAAYYNRGIAWRNKQQYDKAIEDSNKAINLKPDDANPYIVKGNAWSDKKEYENAIEAYNKAIDLKPNYALAYSNRGSVWRKKQQYEKAIKDYEKAIEADSSFQWLKSVIDNLKARTGNIEDVKAPVKEKPEEILYFLVDVVDKLKISSAEKELLKNKGNEVLQAINKILDIAFANNTEPVVHYTKLKVADIIVSSKEEPRLRFYNVVYMNDPEEGEVLFDWLNDKGIKDCFNAIKQKDDNNIYLGSFLPAIEENSHEDELVMWRTYGKDELMNEAAGCSIVIDYEFFGTERNYSHPEMNKKMADSTPAADAGIRLKSSQSLYKVLYYDKRKKEFVGENKQQLNDAKDNLIKALKDFIRIKKQPKLGKGAPDTKKAIDSIVYRFLSEIRYLFKSADYAFENELRVFQYATPKQDEEENLVRMDDNGGAFLPRRLYIESNNPIRPHIKKIILGPKVANPSRWIYLEAAMKMKGYDMEMKYSICKFL